MKDAIGQEIKVGDMVFHSETPTVRSGVYEVTAITPRMVQVLKLKHRKHNRYRASDPPKAKNVLWRPERVVVVTMNIAMLKAIEATGRPITWTEPRTDN